MLDLLKMLENKEITLDEAEYLFESTFKKFHRGELTRDWSEELGFFAMS